MRFFGTKIRGVKGSRPSNSTLGKMSATVSTILQELASMRVTRSTMAACVICSCLLLFTPPARAGVTPGATGTKDTNEDHHDRLPSLATAQRLKVQDDQDAAKGNDTSHEQFYDATLWSDDDVSLSFRAYLVLTFYFWFFGS